MKRFLICGVGAWLAMAAFSSIKEMEDWKAAHPEYFKPEPKMVSTVPLMKGSLSNRSFSVITGGMPIMCGNRSCTLSFCWPHTQGNQGKIAHCLTANHVFQEASTVTLKLVSEEIRGERVQQNAFYDWAVLEIPYHEHSFSGKIAIMDGFDNTPIVGATVPTLSEAVWKLGAFSGMSLGRVVQINTGSGTFLIDGMAVAEGDSGGVVCLGESFQECRLVGIIKEGNESDQYVVAALATTFLNETLVPLRHLERKEDEIRRKEDEIRRKEDEIRLKEDEIRRKDDEIHRLSEKSQMKDENWQLQLQLKEMALKQAESALIRLGGQEIPRHTESQEL